MGLTGPEIEELLALRALGVIDAADDLRLDDELARRPELAGLLAGMEGAVAALDNQLLTGPPLELRNRVLAGLSATARPGAVAPSPIDGLFGRQVEALSELLAELDDESWEAPASPYPWSVHGLVAHLAVIEDYTAVQLRLATDGPAEAAHLDMGLADIAAELAAGPAHTVERWRARARATAAALVDGTTLPTEVGLHGWPLGLQGTIVARSFELWTHADDIRRATGRPLAVPTPGDLRAMSSFSVQGLPFTLARTAPEQPLTATRIVLTGPGGGTFDLGGTGDIGQDGAPSTLLVADVVGYCRVVARRVEVDDLDCTIAGDEGLARALLRSASAFAV